MGSIKGDPGPPKWCSFFPSKYLTGFRQKNCYRPDCHLPRRCHGKIFDFHYSCYYQQLSVIYRNILTDRTSYLKTTILHFCKHYQRLQLFNCSFIQNIKSLLMLIMAFLLTGRVSKFPHQLNNRIYIIILSKLLIQIGGTATAIENANPGNGDWINCNWTTTPRENATNNKRELIFDRMMPTILVLYL